MHIFLIIYIFKVKVIFFILFSEFLIKDAGDETLSHIDFNELKQYTARNLLNAAFIFTYYGILSFFIILFNLFMK